MIGIEESKLLLQADGSPFTVPADWRRARENTIAWKLLHSHNLSGNPEQLRLKFDALVSPDNNYVSILQTARAAGLERFPVPYVLTNCHNSLCAVGGTINEDDHIFGLDNARRLGGIFVPPYKAVLHQYMRECMAGGGKLILGSDSHTRYGALGTMGFGEGGGEIVRQLMGESYDMAYPEVLAVVLRGRPRPGVGPCDVALALIAAVFETGFARNKVLEFIGPGIGALDMDFRMGIDVMTTESGALSSVWATDEITRAWLEKHGRGEAYQQLSPVSPAGYDGAITLNLEQVEPMMALPFHPSRALPIRSFRENAAFWLREVEAEGKRIKRDSRQTFSLMDKLHNGELYVDQGLICGCAGGLFGNITAAADVLQGAVIRGSGPALGIHPASQAIQLELMRHGVAAELLAAGATLRPAMCGSCFGVMDVPGNNQLSVRHVTRNYPNREGSRPSQGQMAATILMDARSVAATLRRGGRLTAADELDVEYRSYEYRFDPALYQAQICDCSDAPQPETVVRMGPNIAPWPEIPAFRRHLLLYTAGSYEGSVTTDELVPSGEATAWRSNPEKLAGFTMQSRDPEYRSRALGIRRERQALEQGEAAQEPVESLLERLTQELACGREDILLGSLIVSEKIGDGSSREQAVSCQKVLGGMANVAMEYSTKRYRSNCINWGVLPLRTEKKPEISQGEWLLIRDLDQKIEQAGEFFALERIGGGELLRVTLDALTEKEKKILLHGCLINYYRATGKKENP